MSYIYVIDGGDGFDTFDARDLDAWINNSVDINLTNNTVHVNYWGGDDNQKIYNVEVVKTGSADDTWIGEKEMGIERVNSIGRSQFADTIDADKRFRVALLAQFNAERMSVRA